MSLFNDLFGRPTGSSMSDEDTAISEQSVWGDDDEATNNVFDSFDSLDTIDSFF